MATNSIVQELLQNATSAAASGNETSVPFCHMGMMGGSVMGMGFGVGFGAHRSCLLFLAPGLDVDTPLKYGGAVVGCFLVGFAVEAVRALRGALRRRRVHRGVDAALFAGQMFIAYSAMLLVMTYDVLWMLGLVSGLGLGLFLFDRAARDAAAAGAADNAALRERLLTNESVEAAASPCCGDK